jgi:hypothetical protein
VSTAILLTLNFLDDLAYILTRGRKRLKWLISADLENTHITGRLQKAILKIT